MKAPNREVRINGVEKRVITTMLIESVFKKSKKLFLVKLPLSSSEKYSMNTK